MLLGHLNKAEPMCQFIHKQTLSLKQLKKMKLLDHVIVPTFPFVTPYNFASVRFLLVHVRHSVSA